MLDKSEQKISFEESGKGECLFLSVRHAEANVLSPAGEIDLADVGEVDGVFLEGKGVAGEDDVLRIDMNIIVNSVEEAFCSLPVRVAILLDEHLILRLLLNTPHCIFIVWR